MGRYRMLAQSQSTALKHKAGSIWPYPNKTQIMLNRIKYLPDSDGSEREYNNTLYISLLDSDRREESREQQVTKKETEVRVLPSVLPVWKISEKVSI